MAEIQAPAAIAADDAAIDAQADAAIATAGVDLSDHGVAAKAAKFEPQDDAAAEPDPKASKEAWEHREAQIMGEFERIDADSTAKTREIMQQHWGTEFSGNIETISGFLDKLGMAGRAFRTARMEDGTPLLNSPLILSALASVARRPSRPTQKDASMPTDTKDAAAEYKGLQKQMREDRRAYDKDGGAQARMRDLIDVLHREGKLDKQGNLK